MSEKKVRHRSTGEPFHLHGSNFVMAVTDDGIMLFAISEGDAADGVDEAAWLQFSKWASKIGPQSSWLKDSKVEAIYSAA